MAGRFEFAVQEADGEAIGAVFVQSRMQRHGRACTDDVWKASEAILAWSAAARASSMRSSKHLTEQQAEVSMILQ